MFIATLIAADALSSATLSDAEDRLRTAGIMPMGRSWVELDSACDLLFSADPRLARAALDGQIGSVDVVVQGEAGRAKRLLVADMDSTMISVECIDELADYAGVKLQVAAITERAMQGELDFAGALRARVALLSGLHVSVLARCYEERVRITPGAETLVRTMRAHRAATRLVSGGFTFFAERVADAIGFDGSLSNRLGVSGDHLDGAVADPIVGAEAKKAALIELAATNGVELAATLAIGDGANDVPMLETAGLGVSYRAKPAAEAAADAAIRHNDLTALLFAQGYPRSAWIA